MGERVLRGGDGVVGEGVKHEDGFADMWVLTDL